MPNPLLPTEKTPIMRQDAIIAIVALLADFFWHVGTGFGLSLTPISETEPVISSGIVSLAVLVTATLVTLVNATVGAKYLFENRLTWLLFKIALFSWLAILIIFMVTALVRSHLGLQYSLVSGLFLLLGCLSIGNWLVTGAWLWVATSNQLHKPFNQKHIFLILFSVALLGLGLGYLYGWFIWKHFIDSFGIM
jgi:hypothetical protein